MNFTWDPPAINYRYTLLATSSDAEGKEFSKPPLGIFAHEGNTTNIIMPDRRVTSGWSPGTVWIDEKPGIPESEKFKIIALYYWNCPSLAEHRGLARSSLDRLMGFNGSDSGRMRATLAVTRKMSHSGMRRLASTWLSDAITVAHSVPTPLALSASSTALADGTLTTSRHAATSARATAVMAVLGSRARPVPLMWTAHQDPEVATQPTTLAGNCSASTESIKRKITRRQAVGSQMKLSRTVAKPCNQCGTLILAGFNEHS